MGRAPQSGWINGSLADASVPTRAVGPQQRATCARAGMVLSQHAEIARAEEAEGSDRSQLSTWLWNRRESRFRAQIGSWTQHEEVVSRRRAGACGRRSGVMARLRGEHPCIEKHWVIEVVTWCFHGAVVAPTSAPTRRGIKKPLRCGTGGAKSLVRSGPSRRVANDGYDGGCDRGGEVGKRRCRAVRNHDRIQTGRASAACQAGDSSRIVRTWIRIGRKLGCES